MPLDRLAEIHHSSPQTLSSESLLPLLEDILSTIDDLLINNDCMQAQQNESKGGRRKDNLLLSLALIFLGNGLLDEAQGIRSIGNREHCMTYVIQ